MSSVSIIDQVDAAVELEYAHCGGDYRVCQCFAKQFCPYVRCWADEGELCPKGRACPVFDRCPAIKNPVDYCMLAPEAYSILQPSPLIRGEFLYNWDIVWTYYPEQKRYVPWMELRMVCMWSDPEAPISDGFYDEYIVASIRELYGAVGETDETDDGESSDMETPETEQIDTTAAAPELPVMPPSGDAAAVDGPADEENAMATHL